MEFLFAILVKVKVFDKFTVTTEIIFHFFRKKVCEVKKFEKSGKKFKVCEFEICNSK